jgi:uncharacterized DUF497 family protein
MNNQLNLNYKGGSPDSKEAFFSIDVSGPENEDVTVEDFIWNRKKSNENILDTRQGKGFSFYYARHAFTDVNKRIIHLGNGRNKIVARISDSVYIVIDTEDDRNFTRILSAWKITEPYNDWIRFYFRSGKEQVESIIKFGKPIYIGANDELSEKYTQEAMKYIQENILGRIDK